MNYNFDEIIDRKGTYSTQWDYIGDRFSSRDLLPFTISDTDFKVPQPIIKKLHEIIEHGVYGYSRWNNQDFKGSITEYFDRRFSCTLSKESILYSPSVMYSVSLLLRLVASKKDKVVSFSPMYDAFYHVVEANGFELLECYMKYEDHSYAIDFECFEHQIKQAKVLLLCSPHNPTGYVFSEKELNRIVELCQEHEVFIISDEIHMDVLIGDKKHIPIMKWAKNYDKIALVSSSSKTFNTPALIGSYVAVANQELYDQFLNHTRKRDFLNSVSLPGMHALIVGYRECDDYVDQLCDYIKQNMIYLDCFLEKYLPEIKRVKSSATYLAWLDITGLNMSQEELQVLLVNQGKVAIMNGEQYGDKRFIRLNCGCPLSKLKRGCERMVKAIKGIEVEL